MKLLASALTAGGLVVGGSGVITLTEAQPSERMPERAVVERNLEVCERMSANFEVWVAQTQQGFEQHLLAFNGFAASR
jgi:hypothetical protein